MAGAMDKECARRERNDAAGSRFVIIPDGKWNLKVMIVLLKREGQKKRQQ